MVFSVDYASQSISELLRAVVRGLEDLTEIKDSMRRMEICIVALTGLMYTVVALCTIAILFHLLCRTRLGLGPTRDELSFSDSQHGALSSVPTSPEQKRLLNQQLQQLQQQQQQQQLPASIISDPRFASSGRYYKEDFAPAVVIRENKNQFIEAASSGPEEMI